MINLYIDQAKGKMNMELHGADGLVLNELSTATLLMLDAMEQCDGHPARENLDTLIMMLIEKLEQSE